jgi:hypothetical protein
LHKAKKRKDSKRLKEKKKATDKKQKKKKESKHRGKSWKAFYKELQTFVEKHGHPHVPRAGPTRALNYWLIGQKVCWAHGKMSLDQATKLKRLGVDLPDEKFGMFVLLEGANE